MLRARPETLFQPLSLCETFRRIVALYVSEISLLTKIALVYSTALIVTWNLVLLPILSTLLQVHGKDFQDPYFLKRHTVEFVVLILLYEMIAIELNSAARGAWTLVLAERHVGRHRPDWFVCLKGGWKVAPKLWQATILTYLVTFLGLTLLIVPGLCIGVRVALLVPVMVVEQNHQPSVPSSPVRSSMTRSAELVQGHWCHVGGILMIVYAAIAVQFFSIVPRVGDLDFGDTIFSIKGSLLSGVSFLVLGPILSCAQFVIYINLRVKKEGLTLEVLKNEFLGVPSTSSGDVSYSPVAVMDDEVA